MASEKNEPKVEVVLAVDFWPEEDVRVAAGTVVFVPVDAAMDMVEKGIAKRAKKA